MKKHFKILVLIVALFFFCALIKGSFSIYKELKDDTIDLNIRDSITCSLRFDPTDGEIDPDPYIMTVTAGTQIGPLPTPTRTGYNFAGWYTDPYTGSKISSNTIATTDDTFYARWVKLVCKKATTLHSETCSSDGSCYTKGYYGNNAKIDYGNIPGVNSPATGDAYDCDVNDDGVYDPATERFYYIREVVEDSGSVPIGNSFLVHYTSFDESGQMDSSKDRGSYTYDLAKSYLPKSSLPTLALWDNSALISMDGNVTRFINRDDLTEACGSNTGGNYFATCKFFLENSRFQSKNSGRAGIWLEKEENQNYRIHTETLLAGAADTDSSNTARPVIQIPSNTIEGYQEKELYRVTFNSQGGNPSTIQRYKYDGQKIGTLPEEPTKTGYTFDGWYTGTNGSGTKITENTVVSGITTYYANWLLNLTINFDANGGTVSPTSKTVPQGRAIGELPNPTYEGYEFLGWFTETSGGTQVTENTVINAGGTIHAHWKSEDALLQYVFYIPGECTFTSSGLANGTNGNCVSTINPTGSDIDYTVGSLRTKKYIDTQIALYNSTNHGKDYEIGFNIVSYNSSSNTSRATVMNTKAEINDSTIKYPGLTFRKDETTDNFILQSRETLTSNASQTFASSSVQSVRIFRTGNEIFYSINGGIKTSLNDLTEYNPEFDLNTWFGAAPKNDTATTAQRYFIGTLSNMYIKLAPDASQIANVTFDLNYTGAPSPTDREAIKGNPIGYLTSPTRTGYTFVGWFTGDTGGTQITSDTIIDDDITFYAHWAENITVTFDANGGTVSPNTKTFGTGMAIGELPTPEYTGHSFLGWYMDNTWNTEVTSSTVFNSGTTIVAKWAESITVTFDPNGGSVSPISKTFGTGTAIGELPTPEYDNHTFKGWYTDNTWATEVTTSTVFNSGTTIVAKWVENVTISFDADGGTASFNSKSIEPGTAIGELPTATKTNKIFDGWYLDNGLYDTEITDQTVANTGLNVIAKWININYVAEVNGTQYETLDEAIADVPKTGVKTTVTLLDNVELSSAITIQSTQNVELDLQTFTISGSSSTLFINEGTLNISNGTITSSAPETSTTGFVVENKRYAILNISGGLLRGTGTNVIINAGTINMTGGRLEATNQSAAINNNQYGVMTMSAGEIVATSTTKGQAIYNNKGTLTISGTAYLENKSQTSSGSGRACVHNNEGTVNILGGTIVSKANAGVKNNDTMTIGSDDGSISTTSPVIQGHTYGLETVSGKTVIIYDGIFRGGAGSNPKKAISNETYTSHSNYIITHDTETIDNVTYDIAYLVAPTVNYTVTFNALANGGSIDPGGNNTQTYTAVGPIGDMPTASKTNAAFLGWFTSASGGEKVLTTTEVNDDITYYAHYTSQTTVCRPATTLHSSSGTDFGQLTSGGILSSGDAFDCDVDGDGTYDATTERFYYLTDSSDGNAIFVFYNNTSQAGGNNGEPICSATAVAYGSNGPSTASGELPTTTQWTNVSLYSEPRDISDETGSIVQNDYIYAGKAARLATLNEIKAATSSSINGTANELANYEFLLENTISYGSGCRSNYWLETYNSVEGVHRINGASDAKSLGHATGNSGVRPVIEVPYSSVDGAVQIVPFDTIPTAMRTYFNNVSTWNIGQSDANAGQSNAGYTSFETAMYNNLSNNNCVYYLNDNVNTGYGSVYCDQPNKYDTGVTGNINVYEYNESTGVISNSTASYVFNDNGKLYNFIPGKVYYWESASDSTKNGYVRPTGERRLISIPGTTRQVRNVRDLGGLPVDTDGNGTIDGTIKYQKLYRGEKLWGTNHNGVTRSQFEALGIYNEFDLRTQNSEIVPAEEDQLSNYTPYEIVHYKIDHTEFGSAASETRFNGKSYYQLARDAAIDVMQKVVAGNDDYALYFHCRIGADRTGTLAYILEGLLGVPTEYRYQDYELTTFYGLRERTRYYYKKDSTNDSYKFIYLKKAIRHATQDNDEVTGIEDVWAWFTLEGTTVDGVNLTNLVNQFRTKMIDSNS